MKKRKKRLHEKGMHAQSELKAVIQFGLVWQQPHMLSKLFLSIYALHYFTTWNIIHKL